MVVTSDKFVAPSSFENDEQRLKFEEGLRIQSQQKSAAKEKKISYKEYLEMKRNQSNNGK